MKSPLVLAILDGWGMREKTEGNAIAQAHTPHYDSFLQEYPYARLDASGHAVGLPEGLMGNSEVGHLNIGAGRIVYVGLTRVYAAIEDQSFFSNPALLQAFNAAKQNDSTLHLMGLVSDGGVHSHQDHLYALLKMAKAQGITKVAIHVFTDGRDTPPDSGRGYLQQLEEQIKEIGVGKIATVVGRYYAMDRDQRWERTQLAYDAMVRGAGEKTEDPNGLMLLRYQAEETDEFLKPIVATDAQGNPLSRIGDRDAIVFFNFRADRARQMTRALTEKNFSGFPLDPRVKISSFVCMGEYDKKFSLPVAYSPVHLENVLAKVLADHGLKQLRVAETEKYAHVTFFFNGGEELAFPGEERLLVPSPREVPTYDLKPEMSAAKIGDHVVESIAKDKFDVIILNFANADMVGHTGNLTAAKKAVEAVDEQLGRIAQAILAKNGTLIISADHGNCEQMFNEAGQKHTAHTTDLVPFILISESLKNAILRPFGTLADIAPSMLQLLKIPQAPQMTGKSMIV